MIDRPGNVVSLAIYDWLIGLMRPSYYAIHDTDSDRVAPGYGVLMCSFGDDRAVTGCFSAWIGPDEETLVVVWGVRRVYLLADPSMFVRVRADLAHDNLVALSVLVEGGGGSDREGRGGFGE